jgi:hypothetical protein
MPDTGCSTKYDELLILARDARIRRRRNSRWTTAFVLTGIIGTAVIVSTANQSAADLTQENERLDRSLLALEGEREAMRAERDLYVAAAGWLADLAKPATPTTGLPKQSVERETELLRDVVWLVEGSRQVPMATGDFLWIPEATAWVEMINIQTGEVRLHWNRSRTVSSPEDLKLPIQLKLNDDMNTARYACIRVFEGISNRPNFGGDFRDIDIRFQSDCEPYEVFVPRGDEELTEIPYTLVTRPL